MTTEGLNLFVVDDDEAVRRSLGMLFLSRGHAVQTFAGGEAFLATANLHDGGCVVLDLRMGSMSGLQVFDELRSRVSALAVLFLSGNGDIAVAVDAVQKGAFGWLEKPCDDERLLEKVQQALAWSSAQSARLWARRNADALWQKLTPREKEVARLVAEGKPNKVIARDLAPIEPRTIESHRAHIFAKLRLSNSNELDRFLREHGL
jgi:two-component system, LuxR family, response regulator TtrR